MVAQECIHSKVEWECWGVIKQDMEKAYDRVEWTVLLEIMKNMGFRELWRKWISGCLSSAHFTILYKECFNLLVRNVERSSHFKGFQMENGGPYISHLQYADDTLLFCEAEVGQEMEEMLGCKVENFPITCLGMPISNSRLSIAIPSSVARKIETLMRNFLWGSSTDSMKFHRLRWDRVCTPKSEGGLGIRRVKLFNQALLCKWWWRSLHFKDHLWYKVIAAKYEVNKFEMWVGLRNVYISHNVANQVVWDIDKDGDYSVKSMPKERWVAPLMEVFKLNFDGNSLGNPGLVGFEGVVRDWNGSISLLMLVLLVKNC
ncbi:uncharacterized protein LOC105420790 [Amborella trichopoda]|uniref:uncharacterized protein LOC105420790 n=1 Tax=Amborella trichopoda TaxID=13333 RepID=UPI0005D36C65|nr:uncharacterized protein LOC105420790 [Amborella trichopoda]|eukprot:XP_011624179.1 uncharacterized protein LOC105420790 [Amborella trichopoda]